MRCVRVKKEKRKVMTAVQTSNSKDRCTDEHIYVKMIFSTVRVGDVLIVSVFVMIF